MEHRLDRMPDAMRIRRQTVEHVFGTLKDSTGRGHFETRRLPNVGTEISLHVLAYTMKRAVTWKSRRARRASDRRVRFCSIAGAEA